MDGLENENDMDEDGNLDLSGDESMNNNEINQSFRMFLSDWERQRRMASIQFVCYLVQYIYIMGVLHHSNYVDDEFKNSSEESQIVRDQLMRQLIKSEKCKDVIRMSPLAFSKLCALLRDTDQLKDNKNSIVEERVAKFLHVLAHNVRNRTMSFFFRRSGETISRHFHEVLWAIISMVDQFLRQPNGVDVPEIFFNNHRFYPYFKVTI